MPKKTGTAQFKYKQTRPQGYYLKALAAYKKRLKAKKRK
jgi:hypothetical protein